MRSPTPVVAALLAATLTIHSRGARADDDDDEPLPPPPPPPSPAGAPSPAAAPSASPPGRDAAGGPPALGGSPTPPIAPPSAPSRSNCAEPEISTATAPETADWEPGKPVPPGWVARSNGAGLPFFIAGGAIFAAGYAGAWVQGASCSDLTRCKGTQWLIVPSVGPFIFASQSRDRDDRQLAYAWGVVPLVADAAIVVGFVREKDVLQRVPVALAPTATVGGGGLLVAGSM